MFLLTSGLVALCVGHFVRLPIGVFIVLVFDVVGMYAIIGAVCTNCTVA